MRIPLCVCVRMRLKWSLLTRFCPLQILYYCVFSLCFFFLLCFLALLFASHITFVVDWSLHIKNQSVTDSFNPSFRSSSAPGYTVTVNEQNVYLKRYFVVICIRSHLKTNKRNKIENSVYTRISSGLDIV